MASETKYGGTLRIGTRVPQFHRMVFSQTPILSFPGSVVMGFRHPMVLVAVAAFQILTGTLIAAERESGFLDLILARAVPRSSYFAATLLLVVTGALVLPLSILGGTALGLATEEHADEVPWHVYLPAAGVMSALLLSMGGISLLLAAGARRRAPAAAGASGLLLAFIVLESLASQSAILARYEWLSLFSYYRPVAASVGSGFRAGDVVVLLGVFTFTTLIALQVFLRRDL